MVAMDGNHHVDDSGWVEWTNLVDGAVSGKLDTTALAAAVTTPGTATRDALDAAFAVKVETVNIVAASGAAQTIPDVIVATVSVVTLTAACTFTFPTAVAGKSFSLILSGAFAVFWPGTVKWPGGASPSLTSTAGKSDAFSFVCLDGASWLGFCGGKNF